jgi:CHAD domain-containing protein
MPSRRRPDDLTTSLLKQRIRAVFRQFPKGLAGDEEAIHQLRVAGRRLRTALPLLARKPDGKRVTRALRLLRDVGRTAGASRDRDVSLALFEKRLKGVEEPTAEQRVLLRRLRAARSRSRGRLAEGLLDLEIAGLRRDLRKVLERGAADVFTVLRRVAEARETGGSALIAGLAEIGDRYEPEAIHGLRRRGRQLRYAAEVAAHVRPEATEAAPLWKAMQDAIGDLHDHQVLARWLTTQAVAAAARGQSALAAAAWTEHAAALEEAQRRHREFLDSRPEELVARALQAMGRPAA